MLFGGGRSASMAIGFVGRGALPGTVAGEPRPVATQFEVTGKSIGIRAFIRIEQAATDQLRHFYIGTLTRHSKAGCRRFFVLYGKMPHVEL
jgi:hypothetical protein